MIPFLHLHPAWANPSNYNDPERGLSLFLFLLYGFRGESKKSHAKGHPQRDYRKILFKTPFSHQVFLCWKNLFLYWRNLGTMRLREGPDERTNVQTTGTTVTREKCPREGVSQKPWKALACSCWCNLHYDANFKASCQPLAPPLPSGSAQWRA